MSSAHKILVATPEPAALVEALRRDGWEPVMANDGPDVYRHARAAAPAAILIDYRLERGGCVPAVRDLSSSAHTAHVPVIVLTPANRAARDECQAAGAHLCLNLPIEPPRICSAIRASVKSAPPIPRVAPPAVLQSATRMAALRASGLLDSPLEPQYERLTRFVARLLHAPVALLSLVDKDRQFFKSQVGLPEPWAGQRQTPLSHSFCQWVVSGREQVAIDDAQIHPVLKTNQAIKDLGVVAYLGVPVSSEGEVLGSLCAIDSKPRSWQSGQMTLLKELACQYEALIAQAILVHKPPRHAVDFDPYVNAAANAQAAAISMLRRESFDPADRDFLLELIGGYGNTLVQLNRLIQTAQALDR